MANAIRSSGTGKRYSNRKETSCVPLLNAGFEAGVPDTKSPADWMLADKPTELSRIKQKLDIYIYMYHCGGIHLASLSSITHTLKMPTSSKGGSFSLLFCSIWSRSRSECILVWRSWRIHASISSVRGHLAPPIDAESDIVREKMRGKQTKTRLGTRLPAYYDVTGTYR